MPTEKDAATIAVFVPLRQTFSYHIQPELLGKLQAGMRVVVPFRNRDVIGVYLGMEKCSIDTKPIKHILDHSPLFPPHLLKLAEWASSYYLAPIGELLKMMAPRDELKKRVTLQQGDGDATRLREKAKTLYLHLAKPLTLPTVAAKTGSSAAEVLKIARPQTKKDIIRIDEQFYLIKPEAEPLKWSDYSSTDEEQNSIRYTKEQAAAVKLVAKEMAEKSGKTVLLHGVTGSGKTEVYMALCEKALAEGGTALLLVPEIGLTFQFVRRFYARFGSQIALLHSGLTPAQRRDEWFRAKSGEARIVIGARSAIFAPLQNIRLIVVDEEHDSSYKQSENPPYSARDIAVVIAGFTGAAALLGSATPSIESYHNAKSGKYLLAEMPNRVDNKPMPEVSMIEVEPNDERILPTEVVEKLLQRLQSGEQSMILINRRGSAKHLRCDSCGDLVSCPNCSISLTPHTAGAGKITCHYCGFELKKAGVCGSCKVGKTYYHAGIGTQAVEKFVKQLFPKAAVARLDQDTAPTREKSFAILGKFERAELDILIGTQMVAKGHDFKNLTFSAILGADDYLAFPDFRSSERTSALITQAAGRTGRGSKKGEVIVTTSICHYAIEHGLNHDYKSLYKDEMKMRKITGYPPFSRLIGVLLDSTSEQQLKTSMIKLSRNLPKMPAGVELYGPTEALIYKIRNRYRWKMLIKGKSSKALHLAAEKVAAAVTGKVTISIDVDPSGFF